MEDITLHRTAAGIVTVTLARPQKRNAVSLAMWRELGRLYHALGEDPAVRVVILTGAGGHFSAGADISEFGTVRSTPEDIAAYEETGDAATAAIRDCPKPTIAAVAGFGVGGGCGLALACDLRVGDATTRMGIPAAKRGVVYGTLDTGLLLRAVGLSAAKLILYSARLVEAAEARRLGLLDVLAEGEALPAAEALAAEIAANAPLSVAGSKLVLEALARGETDSRMAEIHAAMDRASGSADYREASQAFVEKRPAVFRGA
ncbi:enoyl-CoA hydratase-related protein [Siccirubricoccus phaeus]|uniref:enoyl-CoA hydratase-related protein n=1 Tax=Siccirubricoccus phaeus TaxID=2595053 RepID=UPI001A9C7DD5|nr:enoyl-CoA hydratase-related protein [Siccirubricoccus phaeus]